MILWFYDERQNKETPSSDAGTVLALPVSAVSVDPVNWPLVFLLLGMEGGPN